MHGTQPVLGFRFGNMAYLTDFSSVAGKLEGAVGRAGRLHPRRAEVRAAPDAFERRQSLALVEELKPKRAWFTHICHDLGHAETNAKLPENVRLAYDGLKLEGCALMPFEVVHSADEWVARFGEHRRSSVVTIGNFDGVHLRPPANSPESARSGAAGRIESAQC